MNTFSFIPLIFMATMLAGCCAGPRERPIENVPTDTMAKVVADINANNAKVPTLWAHHFYEANIVDEQKHAHFVSGDGTLLYQSPMNMRLLATAVVGTVFDIGSNAKSFWLKLGPQAGDTMWWGRYEDLAQINPDTTGIPIRPDMVLDVLGIATINPKFDELPAPTMRFNAEGDAYVFVWNGKLTDRWVALREVWYDRKTKRPRLVLLYDLNGRVVLRAVLGQYRQIAVQELTKDQWPWVPGDYKLSFPDSGSRLQFTLEQSDLEHAQDEVVVPNPRSFRMPSPTNSGVGHVIQIGGKEAGVIGRLE